MHFKILNHKKMHKQELLKENVLGIEQKVRHTCETLNLCIIQNYSAAKSPLGPQDLHRLKVSTPTQKGSIRK